MSRSAPTALESTGNEGPQGTGSSTTRKPHSSPLLEAHKLSVLFPLRRRPFAPPRFIHAVDDVSLFLRHGETLGLAGESGCGKTTLARALLRLIEPTYGTILLDGEQIQQMTQRQLRPLRKRMQMIFQDSLSAMDTRMTVEQIVAEGIVAHRLAKNKAELRRMVHERLDEVGLSRQVALRHPQELSGGERQRVGIARALAVEPSLVVCDEPVASLDVSVQAQILELLLRLQKERGLSYLFISHDLSVLRWISDRLAVMYMGRIVEEGPTEQVVSAPAHPYTRALLAAVPTMAPGKRKLRLVLPGEPSDPSALPSGCPFHSRCPSNDEARCVEERPELVPVGEASRHRVACWYPVGPSRT